MSFTALRQAVTAYFDEVADHRQQGKCIFSQSDILMSAFACMYFQEPSLLQFQQQMENAQQKNNLRTLFGIENIPQESQLREVLDHIPGEVFAPIFKELFGRLRRHKHLEDYTLFPNVLMCTIDGTQYHSSRQVHCAQCLHKEHTRGEKTYSHAVLQGAIMHPDKKQVLPVMPEAIQNTDGSKKQDCESNAAKRFIEKLKKTYPRQRFLICGDGLMSHQPLIEVIRENNMHYILVCKPGDHQYLSEWLSDFPELPTLEIVDNKGRTHRYRWQNSVPLQGQANAINVNFFEHSIINKQGKTSSINSWVTDINMTPDNVLMMTRAGRCRWKIENECFNTLKNQGYYIEHNYGHGKQYLSYNMYLLTLLAFYFHQIFELTDGTYQACRKKFGSKRHLWEKCRGMVDFIVHESWERLLDLLLHPDDYQVNLIKKS